MGSLIKIYVKSTAFIFGVLVIMMLVMATQAVKAFPVELGPTAPAPIPTQPPIDRAMVDEVDAAK